MILKKFKDFIKNRINDFNLIIKKNSIYLFIYFKKNPYIVSNFENMRKKNENEMKEKK